MFDLFDSEFKTYTDIVYKNHSEIKDLTDKQQKIVDINFQGDELKEHREYLLKQMHEREKSRNIFDKIFDNRHHHV